MKTLLKERFWAFKKWVENIQAAVYNSARTTIEVRNVQNDALTF